MCIVRLRERSVILNPLRGVRGRDLAISLHLDYCTGGNCLQLVPTQRVVPVSFGPKKRI